MSLYDWISYMIDYFGKFVNYMFSLQFGTIRLLPLVIAMVAIYLVLKYFLPKG